MFPVNVMQVAVRGLLEEVRAALLPIVHSTVDVWTCEVSGKKYLGINIFWVDREFQLHRALVSVSPTPSWRSCGQLF